MTHSKHVVVTGAQGEIAKSVIWRLRQEGFEVDPLERGDDVAERIALADACVILDATTPGTDYRLATEAVAQALGRADVKRLVSVTLVPRNSKDAEAFRASAEAAEVRLAGAGHPLVVLRVGLVVGTPDQPSPSDVALFQQGKQVFMPGDGEQLIRPLLIDDLAGLVLAALRSESPPGTFEAEGPQELTVKRLLQQLNPGTEPRTRSQIWHRTLITGAVAIPVILTLALVLRRTDLSGVHGWVSFIAVAAVMSLIATHSSQLESGILPTSDLLLSDHPPKSLLGVTLRNVSDVWTPEALEARKQSGARARAARKYAVTQRSYWVGLILILSGAPALILGVHDATVSLTSLGTRLSGLTLAVAGGLMIFGGVALLTRWHLRYEFGFLGSIVFAVTLVVISVSALLSGDAPWWTLFAALYFVPAAIVCCAAFWKRGGLPVTSIMATRGQRVLGSVILGGTVITLGQALYASVYVPSTVTPSLSGDVAIIRARAAEAAAFSSMPEKDRRVPFSATVKLSNPSAHAVTILSARYLVKGHQVAPTEPKLIGQQGASVAGDRTRMYVREIRSATIDLGRVIAPGTLIESDEGIARRFLIIAPTGYTFVSLRVDVALARARYEHEREVGTYVLRSGAVHSLAQIEDTSWVHALTRSPRYIHVLQATRGELRCQPPLEIVAYVDDRLNTSRDRWCRKPSRVDQHYGVTVEQFFAEAPLP